MPADRWIIVCCALCLPAVAICDESSSASATQPSPELLEFLGSWEIDGEPPVDPLELDDMAIAEAKRKMDEQDHD